MAPETEDDGEIMNNRGQGAAETRPSTFDGDVKIPGNLNGNHNAAHVVYTVWSADVVAAY